MDNIQIAENKTAINILKGIGISLVTTLILLLIFSIILTYTNIPENTINAVIMIITAISILIGSSVGNIKIKKNGLINGGIIGRKLYYSNISNIKYFKLEIFTKCTINSDDISSNNIWNFRRDNRS